MQSFRAARRWLNRNIAYIKKSKTQAFNGGLVFVGLVQANIEEFRSIIDPKIFGFIIIVVGMIGWYLRTITTKSLSEKVSDDVQ